MPYPTKKLENKKRVYEVARLLLILLFILGGSALITEKLTPQDYTIHFKRECDDSGCKKTRNIGSDRNINIENEIRKLSNTLERLDFFARLTFLRFDFHVTNQTQFNFVVTEPRYEKSIDVLVQCNLNGQDYVFSTNSGIIFKQKASVGNIIEELNKIQNMLINCNPASQNISLKPVGKFILAQNAQIQIIYDEEKYHLKFMADKWNYLLTVLQIFIITAIFLASFYEITNFVKRGLKK